MKQYDTFFVRKDNRACVIHCFCAEPSHGELHFEAEDCYFTDPKAMNVFAQTCWLSAWFQPTYGLKHRIKKAWKILKGEKIELDFSLSPKTIKDMGEWFLEQSNIAEKVAKMDRISFKEWVKQCLKE
jgi:hypothetical protein